MGRYGMAGNYYRRSGYVTLQDVPDPNREYVETFDNLTGGMNTFDLDFRLKGNESPFIQNLTWNKGSLSCRRGQVQIGSLSLSGVLSCYDKLWHGWLLAHVGTKIIAKKIRPEYDADSEQTVGTQIVLVNTGATAFGNFVRYREEVFYKARGVFYRIKYTAATDALQAIPLIVQQPTTPGIATHDGEPYIPVIQLNTDPATGAGDLYQPENRLTNYKKVAFNGDGSRLVYVLPGWPKVTIASVVVDGQAWTKGDKWLDRGNMGFVGFTDGNAPPAGRNNVVITYYQENADAYDSIMSCSHIAVFGGAQELCIVVGNSEAQPNAYFWSGNTTFGMDPTYFPMNQYNLAGDASDEITAFGKQQNMLVIFQPQSTGRAVMGTEEINGRVQITMNYTRINAEIGCDLPGSLQLVENNLVWCSRRHGVCRLKDSSAAYENNIVPISRKVDGDYQHAGLLNTLRTIDTDLVHSADTGTQYVLTLDGDAYEWNYELSDYTNPSWFYHKGIKGVGFVTTSDRALYEVTYDGRIAEFQTCFSDFGEAIEKVYTLPPRNFGSYDRLKNIMSILVTTRGDTRANTRLEYMCDYGSRIDPTPLQTRTWRLVPRDLTFRDLACAPFAFVARRKPGYHNIRHLQIKLYNNEAGADLSIVSAQIFYTFRGRQR